MNRHVLVVLILLVIGVVPTTVRAEDEQTLAVSGRVDGYLSALAERRCHDLLDYWVGVESYTEKRKNEETKYCRKFTRRTKILEWTIESIDIEDATADAVALVQAKTYAGWFRRETCWEGWELRLELQGDVWLIDPSAVGTFRVAEDGCDE